MIDEMKLLRAFIDASGFDITELRSYEYRKLTKAQAADYFKPKYIGYTSCRMLVSESNNTTQARYLIDDNGMYTERLTTPIIDYKLTKKKKAVIDSLTGLNLTPEDIKHMSNPYKDYNEKT